MEIPRRAEVIRAHKERGGTVAAVLPIHYPRALLRAFDILPVEVWGPPGVDISFGSAHLQPYVCSIVANGLSFLLAGGLAVADLILVPHACDSLQGLGSILLDFVRPRQPVLTLYLPRSRRESDVVFLTEELRALYQGLAQATGRLPAEADLMERVRQEEAADRLLAELYRQRPRLPLTDLSFYRLVRAREYLPAEMFADLAETSLRALPRGDTGGLPEESVHPSVGVGLVLSGIVPEPMALLEAIQQMGGTVVADDLACGGRRLYPPGSSQEPFQRMAQSILRAPPDPTRGSPVEDRLSHVLQLVRSTQARGVVFYDVKFCEPELFDLPILRRGLQDAGVPSVSIEVDLNDPLSQQVLTRLEAFLEMVR